MGAEQESRERAEALARMVADPELNAAAMRIQMCFRGMALRRMARKGAAAKAVEAAKPPRMTTDMYEECVDDDGHVFYYIYASGESIWHTPRVPEGTTLEENAADIALPDHWEVCESEDHDNGQRF